jgi:hypothetical protein
VSKALMAPNLARKGNQKAVETAPSPAAVPAKAPPAPAVLPPEAKAMLQAVAALQAEALKSSQWVGDAFAGDARAMHYGDKEAAPIHGRASARDVQDLLEEDRLRSAAGAGRPARRDQLKPTRKNRMREMRLGRCHAPRRRLRGALHPAVWRG